MDFWSWKREKRQQIIGQHPSLSHELIQTWSRVIESVKPGPGTNYSLVEVAFRKGVVVVAGIRK